MLYTAQATQEFLEAYKRLEMKQDANPRMANWLKRKHEEDLDLMRQVRNVLAHNTDARYRYPIAVSDALLATLKDILAETERTALDCAVSGNALYVTHPASSFKEVIKVMSERQYSHVPIVDRRNVVLGVLTDSIIIRLLAGEGKIVVNEIERMSELTPLTSLESRHRGKILFLAHSTSKLEVEEMFRTSYAEQDRITAIFLTRSGRATEPLLGMITRADALLK